LYLDSDRRGHYSQGARDGGRTMGLPEPVPAPAPDEAAVIQALRARTPARVLVGRAGPGYRTTTLLDLRQDQAAAVDAVRAELDLAAAFGPDFVERWGLFEVRTRAADRTDYLLRPDHGRRLDDTARAEVRRLGTARADLQVIVGDGLSAAALAAQVPPLLPLLEEQTQQRGWGFGRPFAIRHCRVGVLNDVGELLDPMVAVLLIGERPGMATAESLSAYLAYRPRPGDADARRNLISNIHARGVPPAEAVRRIVALADQLRRAQTSGVTVKEERPPPRLP
jgi:ethanolamine ammonia-lyase small subunit